MRVLITGGTRGIGRAAALYFAQKGASLILGGRHISAVPHGATFVQGDINDPATREKFESEIKKQGIDVLVNNAGLSAVETLDRTENITEIVNTNLTSAIALTKLAVPYMVRQKSGRIINIASVWGISGASCETVYSASKSGMIGFTKALAAELAPSNITVNAVAPGLIDTGMNQNIKGLEDFIDTLPKKRAGRPEEVAALIGFLASDDARFITGQVINISGGLLI